MPRSSVSQADQELIAHAVSCGLVVSARQVERWREHSLLPRNIRQGLGRGSKSEPAPGSRELVAWLAVHARPGRRPSDLALLAFGAGLAVPEVAVRAAFVNAINRIELSVERDLPPGSSPEDVADAAVNVGLRATMVPARIRRIDNALTQLGISWTPPELTALDPGPGVAPVVSNDWTYTAIQALLAGGGEVDIGTLGALARRMGPVDAAAPWAAMMEYGWPDNPEEAASLLNEEGGLSFLPIGDQRQHLRDLAMSTPMSELLDAFRMAAHMRQWATRLCDAVEGEIEAGQPGNAIREWWFGAFGVSRPLLSIALRDRQARPADTAMTALVLIFVRKMIRLLRRLIPDGQFELLAHPTVIPSFLMSFMNAT